MQTRKYRIKIWNDTGIPDAIRRYCKDHSVSVNAFANQAISEKLQNMDVHSMTIEEIMEAEKE